MHVKLDHFCWRRETSDKKKKVELDRYLHPAFLTGDAAGNVEIHTAFTTVNEVGNVEMYTHSQPPIRSN